MTCPFCGGSGYVETWLPDYQTGGTILVGAARCGCADPEAVESDDEPTNN